MVSKAHFSHRQSIRGYAISPSHMFSMMNHRLNLGVGADTGMRGMIVYRLMSITDKDMTKLSARINRPELDIHAVNSILGRVKLNLVRTENALRIVDITVKKMPQAAVVAAPTGPMTAEQKYEEFCKAAKKAGDPFIEGFASLDETQRTDLALRFARKEPKLIVSSIRRFAISEECVWAAVIEQCCETKEGALETLKRWKELKIADPDLRINVLTLCALRGAATETAKVLEYEVLDDTVIRRIARLCMDNGGAREIAFSRNVISRLNDDDRTDLAIINLKEQGESFALSHFSMFRLKYDSDKAKVAAEHFARNGWDRFSLDIDKFGIKSEKEMNRLAALWFMACYDEMNGRGLGERDRRTFDRSEDQFSDEELATLDKAAETICRRMQSDGHHLQRVLNGLMIDHYTREVPMFVRLIELMRKEYRDRYSEWGY